MDLAEYRRHYKAKHTTIGCKLSHMVAVPIIVASLVIAFFALKLALVMLVGGFSTLWLGHFLFEKNRPALFTEAMNPLIYLTAVIFVAEEWWHLITFQGLSDDSDDK